MLIEATLFQTTHTQYNDRHNWSWPRQRTSTFVLENKPTQTSWQDVAEECFHITNAPEEMLSESQMQLAETHKKASLSVGDIVQVTHPYGTEFFMCLSSGWKRAEANELSQFFGCLISSATE
jgi:hypothetical protein